MSLRKWRCNRIRQLFPRVHKPITTGTYSQKAQPQGALEPIRIFSLKHRSQSTSTWLAIVVVGGGADYSTTFTLFEWSCKTEIMRFYITFAKGISHYVLIVTTVIHSIVMFKVMLKRVGPDGGSVVTRKTFVTDPVSRFDWKKKKLTFYDQVDIIIVLHKTCASCGLP